MSDAAKVPRVVFRVEKLKDWGTVSAAGKHNNRLRATPNAGPGPNIVLRGSADTVADVRGRIGSQKVRSNAVLAVEVIVSASPEYFRPDDPGRAGHWKPERLQAWRDRIEPWLAREFPHAASIVLHLDEATPHYQIIDVPLDEKGKLNARSKYGGKATMEAWQDRAADPVKGLGIERGIKGSLAHHERVKSFYGAVAAPTPKLPRVSTPKPEPLPAPTLAERTPMTSAKAKRDELEAEHAQQLAKREREKQAQRDAMAKAWPTVVAKANAVELAQRKQRDAEATASALSQQRDEAKRQADRLRALPLPEVLERVYGATEAKDSRPSYASRKFDLPDGRQVAVTGDKWIEQGGDGGKGAINAVMHLDGLPFKEAVRLLAEHFDGSALVAERTRQLADQAAQEVKQAVQEPVPTPAHAPTRWQRVRTWLTEVRAMPDRLVDWLRERDLVRADVRGNAVFPRHGGGAFVRGTGDAEFKRTIGQADAGPMLIPGSAGAVYLVEGPVDALAIKAMHPGAAVAALGGNLVKPEALAGRIPKGVKVLAAFDADQAGDRLASEAAKALGAERYAPPKEHKDWAETVKREPWRIAQEWSDGGTRGSNPAPKSAPRKP